MIGPVRKNLASHISSADRARELFKLSKNEESLVVCNKKICFSFGCRFFVYVYMMGACLCISGLYCDDVIVPWDPTKQADYVAQSFIGF